MEANYNANMYLTPTDLDNIENKVEELTIKVQNKIYDGNTSALRAIEVGDNLNNKPLYLSLPRDIYEHLDYNNSRRKIVETTNGSYYIFTKDYDNNYRRGAFVILFGGGYLPGNELTLYAYLIDYSEGHSVYDTNPNINRVKVILPKKMGTITSINDPVINEYIKIYDNDDIMPDYIKNTYSVNGIPYIQQINNIEQGIENLGKYFTKPPGWIDTKNWLGTTDTNKYAQNEEQISNTSGVNIDSFSYIDINRWIHNLNLIEQEDMENVTLWNTYKSEYYWQGHTDLIDYKIQYNNNDIQYGGADIYYEYWD